MGRDLLLIRSRFRDSILESDKLLRGLGAPWSIVDELLRDNSASRVNQSEFAQPISTAIQIALVDQLDSLAIKPGAVLGHSSGEIAAAYAAGVLSHEMALLVSYKRSFVSNTCKQKIRGKGAMLAVGLGEEAVLKEIARIGSRLGIVSLACVNSPFSTTVSGDEDAIVELQHILDAASVFNKRLNVDTAYHSHHMQEAASEYEASLQMLEAGFPRSSTKFISSVTTSEKAKDFGALYWVKNLVSQVRYSEALQNYCRSQVADTLAKGSAATQIFVEIGPHSALSGPTRQTIAELNLTEFKYIYTPSLVRSQDAIHSILNLSATLFENGVPVDLNCANSVDSDSPEGLPTVLHDLPPYPWDHSRSYWHESRLSRAYRFRQHPYHDLLGLRILSSPLHEPIWRYVIGADSLPWLREHVIDQLMIYPGSGYLCMAMEAARQIHQDRQTARDIIHFKLKKISFFKTLIIPEPPAKVEMQLSLRFSKSNGEREPISWGDFRISSVAEDGSWIEHCQGYVAIVLGPPNEEVERARSEVSLEEASRKKLDDIKSGSLELINPQNLYHELRSNGNNYGPNFAAISELRLGNCQALSTVITPNVATCMPSGSMQPHIIHPATLDAIFHTTAPLYYRHCDPRSVVPIYIAEATISADVGSKPGQQFVIATTLDPEGPRSARTDIRGFQANSKSGLGLVIDIAGGELRGLEKTQASVSAPTSHRDMTFRMEWKPDAAFLTTEALKSLTRPTQPNNNDILSAQKSDLLDHATSLYVNASLSRIEDQSLRTSEKHQLDFLDWMKRYRKSDACQSLLHEMTERDIQTTLDRARQAGVEGEMVTRIGNKLTSVLTDDIEPLSLILDGGLLDRLELDSATRALPRLIEFIKLLGFKKSHLKVLEINAGKCSMTLGIFQALGTDQAACLERYECTDKSMSFAQPEDLALQEWTDILQFRTLDIEQDPVQQGFEEGQYDLVIASNTLHAATHVDDALANIRKLLKPRGKLALVEMVRPSPSRIFIHGLLTKWWKGQ